MNGNKYDAAMQRIGYRIVNPDTWRAPSEEDLKRFEEKFGYALPKDYREFVLRFGVTASDGGEWVVRNADGVDAGGVDVFYGLSSGVSS